MHWFSFEWTMQWFESIVIKDLIKRFYSEKIPRFDLQQFVDPLVPGVHWKVKFNPQNPKTFKNSLPASAYIL